MRVRTAVAGLLALLALGLAIFYLLPSGNIATSPDGTGPAPRAGANATLQWRPGTSQQYSVNVDSTFTLTMPGATSGQSMKLLIEGTLRYRTLELDATGVLLGLQFTPINMSIDGAFDTDVNRALATPFRVRLRRDGLPLSFEFPAAISAEHREVLENLVRMFQAVIVDKDNWQLQESNASGRYDASYSRTSPGTVVKQKQRYLEGVAAMDVPQVTSTESITLDPAHDWLTAMTVEETLVTRDAGSASTRVVNHASLALLPGPTPGGRDSWRFVAAPAPAVTDQEVPARAAASLSHEAAEQQLLRGVEELNTATEGRSVLIHQLRDLLLVDDQLPAVLLDTLGNEELSQQTRADLFLAMELAGTPAAQSALSSVLYDADSSPQDAMRAIVALGGVAAPTGETLAALWDLAQSDLADTERRDLPATATLAIGSLGNNLRTAGNDDYLSLRQDLQSGASTATAPEQRAAFLYALGNTADPEPSLRRDIAEYLQDPSARVRSAAASAIGRLGADEVADKLVATVQQESSGQVRAAIVEALATWDQPSATANEWVQRAIRQERDEKTRYNMAVFLGNNMATYPGNRAVLQELLVTEQSRRIRQQLADTLY